MKARAVAAAASASTDPKSSNATTSTKLLQMVPHIHLSDVHRIRLLGTGTFTNVYHVSMDPDAGWETNDMGDGTTTTTTTRYALKCMESSMSSSFPTTTTTTNNQEKVIPSTDALQAAVQSLQREIKLLGQLRHSNIITLHGTTTVCGIFGDDKEEKIFCLDQHGLIVDLLHAETLEQRLVRWRRKSSIRSRRRSSSSSTPTLHSSSKIDQDFYDNDTVVHGMAQQQQRPSPPPLTKRLETIAMGIIQGMEYLHKKNILIRDLQPANIGFDVTTGVVKIFDLGLARTLPTRNKNNNNNKSSSNNTTTSSSSTASVSSSSSSKRSRRQRQCRRPSNSSNSNHQKNAQNHDEIDERNEHDEEVKRAGSWSYQAPEVLLRAYSASKKKAASTTHSKSTVKNNNTIKDKQLQKLPPPPPPSLGPLPPLELSSDIYSLAMILWQLCTLLPLASQRNKTNKSFQHHQQTLVAHPDARPSVKSIPSHLLRTLLAKCWNSNRTARPTIHQVKTVVELKVSTRRTWNWSSRLNMVQCLGYCPPTTSSSSSSNRPRNKRKPERTTGTTTTNNNNSTRTLMVLEQQSTTVRNSDDEENEENQDDDEDDDSYSSSSSSSVKSNRTAPVGGFLFTKQNKTGEDDHSYSSSSSLKSNRTAPGGILYPNNKLPECYQYWT
jgi:serine/threonine protein kinase